MPCSISVSVMAHPDRREQAEYVSEQTGGDIVWDTGGEPSADPARRWKVGVDCWEDAASKGSDWSFVIQDDAIACDDLVPGLGVALEQLPSGGAVSPYTGTGRPAQNQVTAALKTAQHTGSSWMSLRRLYWGVGILLPTSVVEGMLSWCSRKGVSKMNYDGRIGLYVRDILGWQAWYTVPSLLDHRDGGSLIDHGPGRVAHNFVGESSSALDVDWTRTPGGKPLRTVL